MLPLQVDSSILFVWESLVTHGTLKSVLDTTLKSHMSIQVVVPIVAFPTLLALK